MAVILKLIVSGYLNKVRTVCLRFLTLENIKTAAIISLAPSAVIVYGFYKWYAGRSNIPGPSGLAYIRFFRETKGKPPFRRFQYLIDEYGPVVELRIFSKRLVLLGSYDAVRACFCGNKCIDRPKSFVGTHLVQNKGIIFSSDSMWMCQRNFVQKCISQLGASKADSDRAARDKLEQNILKEVQILVETIRNNPGPFDMDLLITRTVGKITENLILGPFCGSEDKKRERENNFDKTMKLVTSGAATVDQLIPLDFCDLLRFFPPWRAIVKRSKAVKSIITSYIQESMTSRCEYLKSRDLLDDPENRQLPNPPSVKECVLDAILVNSRKPEAAEHYFTEQQNMQVLIDLQGAALDTTKSAIQWILMFVARRRNVQLALHNKLDSAVGRERDVKLSDMENLPYLRAVIIEALRVSSVVPVGIPRLVTGEDLMAENIKIPKGSILMPVFYVMNRDKVMGCKPSSFIPERFCNFLDQMAIPKEFIPFSMGERKCLGSTFAQFVMFLVIGNLLKNFKISFQGERPCFVPIVGSFVNSPIPCKLTANARPEPTMPS